MTIDIDSLNPAQREAVLTTEGPLLCLAGAGSGKTRVLTHRIAHLVEDLGVPPWQILAITFTNKAAREMRERLGRLMESGTRGMWICTFHAMCVRMLREYADRLGYTPSFTIYDDDDSKRLVKHIMADLDIDEKANPLKGIRSAISAAKNDMVDAEEYAARAENPAQQVTARVYAELDKRLQRANAMDFDDLLIKALDLLQANPDVLERYQERFLYISVDEYQDTNRAQYRICRMLASRYQNLMVVGDDDQSIYSWRGADIRNILDFEKDYPQAHVVKLEENYRSTGHILEAANAVVAHNTERKAKRLFTSAGDGEKIKVTSRRDAIAEANYVAGEIRGLAKEGASYDEIAVFYRTNSQSRVIEDAMVKSGIPYTIVGGTRFFDRKEIRDLMAYLKLVVNPYDDVSARRVINTPGRGIGDTTQSNIGALAAERGISYYEAVAAYVVEGMRLTTKARNGLVDFLQIVAEGQTYEGDLDKVITMILERTGMLAAYAAENTDEARDRADNLREFIGVAQEYMRNHEPVEDLMGNAELDAELARMAESAQAAPTLWDVAGEDEGPKAGDLTLPGFMEWLALRTDLDAADSDSTHVTLMTVHAAKGLEFDNVFVTGMEETIFPLVRDKTTEAAQMEEERRLAYVAITRARKRLWLTYAESRSLYGQTTYNHRSRFIEEIPPEHVVRVGLGSDGFSGLGYDRRGSRHGIGGVGHGTEIYGGQLVGNRTRSSGGTAQSASAGIRSDVPAPRVTGSQFSSAASGAEFAVGERVNHKKFGLGSVVAVAGDKITVTFDSGGTKQLLKGFAPMVKVVS